MLQVGPNLSPRLSRTLNQWRCTLVQADIPVAVGWGVTQAAAYQDWANKMRDLYNRRNAQSTPVSKIREDTVLQSVINICRSARRRDNV